MLMHKSDNRGAGGHGRSKGAISSKRVWSGVACDFGLEGIAPASGLVPMHGMSDVLGVESEVSRLLRVKDLSVDDIYVLPDTSLNRKTMSFGAEWFYRVEKMLYLAFPMVRLSEPVQAIYDIAYKNGILTESGRLNPEKNIWNRSDPRNGQLVIDFFMELKSYYSSRVYQSLLRHREEQAAHNLESHLLLIDYLLVKHDKFRVVAHDLYLNKFMSSGEVIFLKNLFLNKMRFNISFIEDGYGYLWHFSFHISRGYYFRLFLFISARYISSHEKFSARLVKLWNDATNGLGVAEDCRNSRGELSRVGGIVDSGNKKSVEKIRSSVLYQIEKDKCLRVELPRKMHAFGHSEMCDLDGALLEKAWVRHLSAFPSGSSYTKISSKEDIFQRLHLALVKKNIAKDDWNNFSEVKGTINEI